MSRKILSKSEIKELNTMQSHLVFSKKDNILRIDNIYYKETTPLLFVYEETFVPTLKALLLKLATLPAITVDMGAIKYVTNGADIMRPGITNIEETIKKNDVIAIIDEKNKTPIAIGIALYDAHDMKEGKVVKNIHYVGDLLWNSHM